VIPSLKGAMLSGVLLVFIPAMGEFLIPDLLGGAKVMLAGNLVSEQFLKARDWPFGSALSALLMLLLSIVVIIVRRLEKRAK
jgi:spermidine/putrescine transport system permease protein